MPKGVKDAMVAGAVRLLASKGLESTSFARVLELTKAPRGSLYHHFPDGKDQLVGAAVTLAGDYLIAQLEGAVGAKAPEVAKHFLAVWRAVLEASGCEAGCAVLAVAVATESEDLLSRTTAVFRAWRGRLAELLQQGGLTRAKAASLATLMIAAVEGAVLLSRAEKSLEPFDTVSRQLVEQVRAAMPAQPG